MRYQLLNSASNECVRLGMYYINQNRLEVYADGVYVQPNNGYLDMNGRFRLRTQTTNNQWMPDVNNKVTGENFLRFVLKLIFDLFHKCDKNLLSFLLITYSHKRRLLKYIFNILKVQLKIISWRLYCLTKL